MRVTVSATAAEACEVALGIVARTVTEPGSVLGLATGRTVEPLYDRLREECASGRLSFQGVRTFNLDEYVGLEPGDPASFRATMQRMLFDHIDINSGNVHFPDVEDHPDRAGAIYEAAILEAGGIDLQLLGLGTNGHIGFNEPGSAPDSRTRQVTLSSATRRANAGFFPQGCVPRKAVTMGVGTILEARHCLLLAFGQSKAEAVRLSVEGPLSAAVPATALRRHPNVDIVLDSLSAELLSRRWNLSGVPDTESRTLRDR